MNTESLIRKAIHSALVARPRSPSEVACYLEVI
jgi:hypothetical protein